MMFIHVQFSSVTENANKKTDTKVSTYMYWYDKFVAMYTALICLYQYPRIFLASTVLALMPQIKDQRRPQMS